jgi:hypothetical protein
MVVITAGVNLTRHSRVEINSKRADDFGAFSFARLDSPHRR